MDNLTAWIRDCLTGRKQRVSLSGEAPEWLPVTSGVPRGSALGLILLMIYFNDLKILLKCERKIVLKYLDRIFGSSKRWQIPFNVDVFNPALSVPCKGSKHTYTYSVRGEPLQVVHRSLSSDLYVYK